MKLARYMQLVDRAGVVSYRYNPPADAIEAGIVKRVTLGTNMYDAINFCNTENEKLDEWRREHRYLKNLSDKSTIEDLYKSYINSLDYSKLSDKSKYDYPYYMKGWFAGKTAGATLLKTRLCDLSAPICQRLYDGFAAHSVSLANHTLAVYKLMMSYAIRNGFTTFNPFKAVKTQTVKSRRVVWEREHIKAFMSVAFSNYATRSLGLIVYTAYCAAQRLGDMRMLTWSSYDINTGVLQLEQSKRRARVSVPLPQDLQQMLKQQHDELGWQQYMFPLPEKMKPYTLTGLAKAGRALMEQAGLPEELQLMDLRRTAVTEMVSVGVPVPNIMSLTGHATPQSLVPYMKHTLKSATVAQEMRGMI
jgi:integrase